MNEDTEVLSSFLRLNGDEWWHNFVTLQVVLQLSFFPKGNLTKQGLLKLISSYDMKSSLKIFIFILL